MLKTRGVSRPPWALESMKTLDFRHIVLYYWLTGSSRPVNFQYGQLIDRPYIVPVHQNPYVNLLDVLTQVQLCPTHREV